MDVEVFSACALAGQQHPADYSKIFVKSDAALDHHVIELNRDLQVAN